MSNSKLLLYSLLIIATLAGTAHIATHFLDLKEFYSETVEYWFYIANDLSLIYIIIPFFIIEIIRYAVIKKLGKDVILDSIANVITFGAFIVIEYILALLAVVKLYYWVHYNFSLEHLPLNVVTIFTAILLADFAYYWDHRTMHRIGIGWATHTVHHSSEHFNMSVAYRFGPLDAVFPILFSLPIVMLGFDPLLVLLAEVFVQVFQTLLHTEIIKKLPKPIEYLFNTPSHHRVHHGSNRQYWDKNYAGILIIWDRMLGTFEPEIETVRYGISEPLNSVNPIKVFLHGIARLSRKMSQTKGIINKFKVLIKPPDWTPSN